MEKRIEITERDQDLHATVRKLLALGELERSDRVMFTRGGQGAISGDAGWWADHTVRENAKEGPITVRWRPFPDVRRRSLAAK